MERHFCIIVSGGVELREMGEETKWPRRTMRPKESTMSKESTREYKPPVRIAPPFEAAVEAFLKVDLKKLPRKGSSRRRRGRSRLLVLQFKRERHTAFALVGIGRGDGRRIQPTTF